MKHFREILRSREIQLLSPDGHLADIICAHISATVFFIHRLCFITSALCLGYLRYSHGVIL